MPNWRYDTLKITAPVRWSPEALDTFFSSPLYRGAWSLARRSSPGGLVERDGLYWCPLMARCMALRGQEAAQLHVDDVKTIDGIFVIDLTADEARRLKNRSAHRRVPVPETLIALGFLDYVERRRAEGGKALFPEFNERGTSVAGERLRKKFDAYKRKVVGDRFGFHGLRHTYVRSMLLGGAPTSLVQRCVGHETGGETGPRYFDGTDLQVLKRVADQVAVEAVGHLVPTPEPEDAGTDRGGCADAADEVNPTPRDRR